MTADQTWVPVCVVVVTPIRLEEGLQHGFGTELELIGARSGDRIDHAAGGTPELDRVAAGLDLESLVERERYGRESDAVVEVRDIQAVDVDGVFRHGRTAERNATELALDQARGQKGDSLRISFD